MSAAPVPAQTRADAEAQEETPAEKAATVEYRDEEGNTLVLRAVAEPVTIRKIGQGPSSAAASVDDAWRRRSELLFERLAVSWEIAGLPLTDQKMLLGRYRMADSGDPAVGAGKRSRPTSSSTSPSSPVRPSGARLRVCAEA